MVKIEITEWSGVFTLICLHKNRCKRCFPTGFGLGQKL